MKNIHLIIILFLLVSVLFPDTIITLDGKIQNCKLKHTNNNKLYYDKNGVEESIFCVRVLNIYDDNGNELEFNCGSSFVDLTNIMFNSKKNKERQSLLPWSGLAITLSGVFGYINNNAECKDCDIQEMVSFSNRKKSRADLQYALLTIGGIMLIIESVRNIESKNNDRLEDKKIKSEKSNLDT